MALVIKSWKVNSNAGAGEPHVVIVARKPGLVSFILSLLGIDATVSMQVTARHVSYDVGSLAGFVRRFIPLESVCSTYYGLYKPWKTTAIFIALSVGLGSAFMGHSTGMTVLGTLILFGGIGLALLYYFLNKQLSIGLVDMSGYAAGLNFKRSVIEGQEIDERATESVIKVIEHLIKPTAGVALPAMNIGTSSKAATASPAPLSGRCTKCGAALVAGSRFCDGCGTSVPLSS